mmetsp:Transcript_131330/g.238861  ORF Transcript_131330/g.238861 Transcript_131330/m.238861 type:complete len:218 (+) Transcript_131330:416-1069(+)
MELLDCNLGFLCTLFSIFLLAIVAPMHQDFILSLFVEHEHPRPFVLQDGNVVALLRTAAITHCHSSTWICAMLCVDKHPVASQDAPMLLDVAACEIVIFFQRHVVIESARGGIHYKEVSQDEVLCCKLLSAHGQRRVRHWVHSPQLRLQRGSAHLCEHELRCSHRRDHMTPGASQSCVGFVKGRLAPQVLLRNVQILPLADVVTHLHASLARPGCVS